MTERKCSFGGDEELFGHTPKKTPTSRERDSESKGKLQTNTVPKLNLKSLMSHNSFHMILAWLLYDIQLTYIRGEPLS